MKVGIMTTDGGPHSAEKWSVTTAGQIMDSVFSAEAQLSYGAKAFELELLKILAPSHGKVQSDERDKLGKNGTALLSMPIYPHEHCDDVVAEIAATAKKIGKMQVPGQTESVDLGAHFAKSDVQKALAGLIGAHFASSMDIERSWHADRNGQDPEAQAYRKARTEHGAAHVYAHIHKYRRDNNKPAS